MSRILKIIIALFLLFNLAFLVLIFYPVPKALKSLHSQETVKIYDRNGEILYEVLGENGRQTYVELESVPEHLKNAFLSVEDQRFYEHGGVDLKAILRAIWQNVSAGQVISGGSTITQQVVRNLVGVNKPRSVPQKIRESILAIKLSKFYDKDEIFEVYLNSIYFGGLAYGVEAASQQYFGKSVVNLDLAQSAFLAGLPQAPNRYNPFKNFDEAKARQGVVLTAMQENGKISEEELVQASEEELFITGADFTKKAPHFVDMVLQSLGDNGEIPRFARNDSEVGNDEIHTTLDLGMQERAETILQSDLTFLSKYNIHNGAAVILDARTGEILVMVGSSDYNDESIDGEVNVAVSLRQPGSSIKPLVYASSLEKGWQADTVIIDEPVRFETAEGLPYSPQNFDLQYRGKVLVAEALAQSLNVPAVKTLDYVGVSEFLHWAEAFGITTFAESADHYGLSLALGSGEVKLLELVNAYSTFANDGKRAPVRFIKSGDRVIAGAVVSPETAEVISAILSSNTLRMPAFGEENPLKFSFPVAAKTGTTRNFRDNWTVGFTDDYAVGVWVGNSSGAVMEGVSGISGAGPIFNKIMNMLHQTTGTALSVGQQVDLPVKGFLPDSVGTRYENEFGRDEKTEEFRIISPFANDVFLFDPGLPAEFQKIKFQASQNATWFVDGEQVGEGSEVLWQLTKGQHEVKAVWEGDERIVEIQVR